MDGISRAVDTSVRRVARPDLGLEVALAGVCAASLGAAATGLVAGEVPSGPILCPFRAATGVPCPFCGLTRSLMLAGQGEWSASLDLHVLGPLVLLLAGILLPLSVVRIVRGKGLRWPPSLLAVVGTLVTAGWIFNLATGGS